MMRTIRDAWPYLVALGVVILGSSMLAWASSGTASSAGKGKPAPPSGPAQGAGSTTVPGDPTTVVRVQRGSQSGLYGWFLYSTSGATWFAVVPATGDGLEGTYEALNRYVTSYGDLKPDAPLAAYRRPGWRVIVVVP